MDKISSIIPASKRQVWQTGEVDKPRRVSEPTPTKVSAAPPVQLPEAGTHILESESPQRGTQLNTMA